MILCAVCGEGVAPSGEYVCATCGRTMCGYCADKAGCCGWVPARVGKGEPTVGNYPNLLEAVQELEKCERDAQDIAKSEARVTSEDEQVILRNYDEWEYEDDPNDTDEWTVGDIGGEG